MKRILHRPLSIAVLKVIKVLSTVQLKIMHSFQLFQNSRKFQASETKWRSIACEPNFSIRQNWRLKVKFFWPFMYCFRTSFQTTILPWQHNEKKEKRRGLIKFSAAKWLKPENFKWLFVKTTLKSIKTTFFKISAKHKLRYKNKPNIQWMEMFIKTDH